MGVEGAGYSRSRRSRLERDPHARKHRPPRSPIRAPRSPAFRSREARTNRYLSVVAPLSNSARASASSRLLVAQDSTGARGHDPDVKTRAVRKAPPARAATDGTAASARSAFTFRTKTFTELRRRSGRRGGPRRETVADRLAGRAARAPLQDLARYWATEYDWRKVEAKLNALPQFITEIDGLDIHFIHVRSKHENALPLIVTHGWPGSIIEQLKIIDPLTNPTAHGGSAADAFHVVIPSMPGHGFSGKPTTDRLGSTSASHEPGSVLMKRLRIHAICRRKAAIGARSSLDVMAQQAAAGIDSAFTPTCLVLFRRRLARRSSPAARPPSGMSAEETRTYEKLKNFFAKATSPMHSRWGRARKRSTELRIRRSAWPPGSSTTVTAMPSRRHQWMAAIRTPTSGQPRPSSHATTCSTTSRSTG